MKIILIIIFGFISFNSSANFKGLKLIQNVSVVDVENEEVKKNKDILIKDQKIVAVLPHLISLKSNSIEIINAKGQFATPGLIDMHVHLDLWHYGKQADDWSLPLFIANGITTVRDAAGSDLVLQLRKEITDGSRIGPKMIIASPFMTSSPVADDDQNTIFIKSPEDVETVLSLYLNKGYDFVKTSSLIEPKIFEKMTTVLASKNSYLMGHILMGENKGGWVENRYSEALAHYRTLEHGFWVLGDYLQSEKSPYYHTKSYGKLSWYALAYPDFSKLESLKNELLKSHSMITATIIPGKITSHFTDTVNEVNALNVESFQKHPRYKYAPDYVLKDWQDIIKAWGTNPTGEIELQKAEVNNYFVLKTLSDAGVPILVGTDIPARPTMIHGFSFHDEMDELKKAGLTNGNILKGATFYSAKALGMSDKIGRIKNGFSADIILTKENPLLNLSTLREPTAVISNGRYFSKKDLQNLLQNVEKTSRRTLLTKSAPLSHEAIACGTFPIK